MINKVYAAKVKYILVKKVMVSCGHTSKIFWRLPPSGVMRKNIGSISMFSSFGANGEVFFTDFWKESILWVKKIIPCTKYAIFAFLLCRD